MATVRYATIIENLVSIRQRLQNTLSFPAERVLVLAKRPPYFDMQADQYVWLSLRGASGEQGLQAAAGRIDFRPLWRLEVGMRTRLALDEANQDYLWMTQTSLGHYVLVLNVISGLLKWYAQDTAQNMTFGQSLSLVSLDSPNKDAQDPSWGESMALFDFSIPLQVAFADPVTGAQFV